MRFTPGPVLLTALLWVGCDSADPITEEPPQVDPPAPTFAPADTVAFDQAALSLTSGGQIIEGANYFNDVTRDQVERGFGIYQAGLQIVGSQDGQLRAELVWGERTGDHSNFSSDCDGRDGGVYHVFADSSYADYDLSTWPQDLGAPTRSDSTPLVYGDEMLWASLCGEASTTDPLKSAPFDGLRTNVALFREEGPASAPVFFARYALTNTSEVPITDAYVGFWSDTDLGPAASDLVGFDEERGVSYVYNQSGNPFDSDLALEQSGAVTGFAFVETPDDLPVYAHRIVLKNVSGPYGPADVERIEQLYFALQGLDNDGNPMINPVTSEATRFAFSGDPVAETGWLDGSLSGGVRRGKDVRHLISVGTFALAPGETKVVTVTWSRPLESTLAEGLTVLRSEIDRAQTTPSLWQFE